VASIENLIAAGNLIKILMRDVRRIPELVECRRESGGEGELRGDQLLAVEASALLGT
jgi:hypothetical protein